MITFDLKGIFSLNRKLQNTENQYITYGQMNLITDFNMLWLQLSTWTRLYMISVITGYGDPDAIFTRLYQIPRDFNTKLAVFFGPQTANEIYNLLAARMVVIRNLAYAFKANDSAAINESVSQLYQNADNISELLAKVNPYWTVNQWKNLFYDYQGLMITWMVNTASRSPLNIDIWDRITDHALLLANYMSRGIMQYLVIQNGQLQPPPPAQTPSQTPPQGADQ
jgi:hypothetical protein